MQNKNKKYLVIKYKKEKMIFKNELLKDFLQDVKDLQIF